MLAYRVLERTKNSQTLQKKEKQEEKRKEEEKDKAKQTRGALKNVMQEYRKEAARRTTYVLERNRYLLHGPNNTKITAVARTNSTKKVTAVSWTKTTRRGKRYRYKAKVRRGGK